jgi:hypothetical protein
MTSLASSLYTHSHSKTNHTTTTSLSLSTPIACRHEIYIGHGEQENFTSATTVAAQEHTAVQQTPSMSWHIVCTRAWI